MKVTREQNSEISPSQTEAKELPVLVKENLSHIASYLQIKDLVNLSLTCKDWRAAETLNSVFMLNPSLCPKYFTLINNIDELNQGVSHYGWALTELNLSHDVRSHGSSTMIRNLSNTVLSQLTNLTTLNLEFNPLITDAGLANLTNLTDLNLRNNHKITDASLSILQKLTTINVEHCDQITDETLTELTNLTSLYHTNLDLYYSMPNLKFVNGDPYTDPFPDHESQLGGEDANYG